MKKIISLLMSLLLIFTMSSTAFAAELEPDAENSSDILFSSSSFSEEDLAFFEKMSLVFDGYTTNESGEIIFTYSSDSLYNLGFSESEVARLTTLNETICGTILSDEMSVSSRIFVEDGKIWFTYDDVMAFLFAAASIGPEALYAAMLGLSSISVGPVVTAIIAVVGALGAPSLINFCYNIIQAATYGQGVYIGIEMNGIFPNIVSSTW